MLPSDHRNVMASRREPKDSLEHFPTPPWATRALCEWLSGQGINPRHHDAWEPACAEGHMSRPLAEHFAKVFSSDVHNYGFGEVSDFLWPHSTAHCVDWIITNPPFRLGQQFIERALLDAQAGVAMLVRTSFLESANRYEKMFAVSPPSDILQFVERVPMFKGRLDRHGSTATAYCWLVWRPTGRSETRFHWIAPCRKRLERDSDYPSNAPELAA